MATLLSSNFLEGDNVKIVCNTRQQGLFLVDISNPGDLVNIHLRGEDAQKQLSASEKRRDSVSKKMVEMILHMVPQNRRQLVQYLLMKLIGEEMAREKYDIHFRLSTLVKRVEKCLTEYEKLKKACTDLGFKCQSAWLQKQAQKLLVDTNRKGGRTPW